MGYRKLQGPIWQDCFECMSRDTTQFQHHHFLLENIIPYFIKFFKLQISSWISTCCNSL